MGPQWNAVVAVLTLLAPRHLPAQDPVPAPAAPLPASQVPATEPAAIPRPAPPAYEPRYHTLAEVEKLVAGWIGAANPEKLLTEAVALPATGTGLRVPALAFGASGPTPLADRPTVLLIGGLDGVSLAGCEAVLAACGTLCSDSATLPREIAYLAVPWGSPEALSEMLAGRGGKGADLTPLDDDGDGTVDEDGPDDLDGDGKLLEMLLPDPAGPWVRAADPRFLAPARPGDAPRFVLVREGRDDDRDGKFNEDPRGGVDFDRAFPVGWVPEQPLARGTLLPLEVPACRALADLALARRVVLVLLFQGDHGGLASPGARAENPWPADADAAAVALAGRLFARATSRPGPAPCTLLAAHGSEQPGAALDWFYAVPGALAFEVAPWGPSVEKPGDAANVGLTDALFENAARASGAVRVAPPVSSRDLAWGKWLDNTRGGIGFVDWHPVELGNGLQGLVGGWEPFSRPNPPEKSLAAALSGLPEFVAALAGSLPVLEVRLAEVRRDGDVCTIRARIANTGTLPSGGATTGRAPGSRWGSGAELEIGLPDGARLLAGDARVALGTIAGGDSSREVTWIVLAPPGSVMTLRANAPWTGGIAREVKP